MQDNGWCWWQGTLCREGGGKEVRAEGTFFLNQVKQIKVAAFPVRIELNHAIIDSNASFSPMHKEVIDCYYYMQRWENVICK